MDCETNATQPKEFTQEFTPISLDGLNQTAEMLKRIDNKYVVRADRLMQLLPQLAARFDILEIGQKRAFAYHTRYFDDLHFRAYHEHHQGLRKGFKVRIRNYADAGISYLEVKVKGKRGQTEKHRIAHHGELGTRLSEPAKQFARATYETHYGKPFGYDLTWAIDVRYSRITLVARGGAERVTIDTALRFQTTDQTIRVEPDLFILETKSEFGRGIADRLLRQVGQRPARKCSKYCLGMASLGKISRWNMFLPTLRQLKLATSAGATGTLLPNAVQTKVRSQKRPMPQGSPTLVNSAKPIGVAT